MVHPPLQIDGSKLILDGELIHDFGRPISQADWTEEGILVALRIEMKALNQNIFLLNKDGQVLWQIEDLKIIVAHPYNGYFFMPDGTIEVGNIVGYRCRLDLKTGKVEVLYFHPYA